MMSASVPIWRSHIGRRLLLRTILFSVLVTLLITALDLYSGYRTELSQLNKKLDQLQAGYAESLGESLWNLDKEQIRTQIRGILAYGAIQYVDVREGLSIDMSKSVVAMGASVEGDAIRKDFVLTCRCGDSPRMIGVLRIEASLLPLRANIFQRAFVILLGEAVKIFSISAFILLWVHGKITRPLLEFAGTIRRLGPESSQQLQLSRRDQGDDEISELGNAFERQHQSVVQHIENLHAVEIRLQQREQEFRTLVEKLPDNIARYDHEGRITYVNPLLERFLRRSASDLIGKTPLELRPGPPYAEYQRRIDQVIASGMAAEFELIYPDSIGAGSSCHHIRFLPEKDSAGHVIGVLAIGTDITDRRRMEVALRQQEERLQHLAYHDGLTNLPNRVLLADRLRHDIMQADRKQELLAVAYLDLDNFKPINDSYGHRVGDQVLVEVARRMKHVVRAVDTIARIGGDEFVLLLAGQANAEEVDFVLRRLLQSVGETISVEGQSFALTASIGVSMYPNDSLDPDILLRYADQAMYIAKRSGRNQYVFCGQELRERDIRRSATTHELQQALEQGHITAHFQPIVDLTTGQIYKAEALARWEHAERGFVPPSDFIMLAEETGLIHALGDRVFQLSLDMVRAWNQSCPVTAGLAPRQISVNRSPRQFFGGEGLHNWVESMRSAQVTGDMVAIEITEGLLLEDRPDVLEQLQYCRSLGVALSLDDFGTGYSALSYLKKFSIDILKIDRSFVADIVVDEGDRAIVESIIAMAKRLGIRTIAEGVETAVQRDLLVQAGCDMAQGNFYSKPLPLEAFLAWVQTYSRQTSDQQI